MKLSQLALSYGFAGRLMLGIIWCSLNTFTYSLDAYCSPRSEWCTRPGPGFLSTRALLSAASAKRTANVLPSSQPTTFREKASRITAKYTNSHFNRMSSCLAMTSLLAFGRRCHPASSVFLLASSLDFLQGTFEKIHFHRLLGELSLHFAALSLQSVPIPAVSFQGCSPTVPQLPFGGADFGSKFRGHKCT